MSDEPRLQDSRLLAAYHGLMVHHEAAREAADAIDAVLAMGIPIGLAEHLAEATTQIRAVRKLIGTAITLAEPAVEIAGSR